MSLLSICRCKIIVQLSIKKVSLNMAVINEKSRIDIVLTLRYRNFRTMTCPTPVQFNCVSCDASGEIVAAGTTDTFQVKLKHIIFSHLYYGDIQEVGTH